MQKICIIGSGGSGKSTLSRKLGEKLNLPVHHLDIYFWDPGWVEGDKIKFVNDIKRIISEPKWIIDGNFSGTYNLRFSEADTIIFLDYKRSVCLYNVFKRVFKYWGKRRPDLAEGCYEKFDLNFHRWVWNFPNRTRPNTLKKLAEIQEIKTVVILKSRKETERFLDKIAFSRYETPVS